MKAALRTQSRTDAGWPKRCGPRNLSNDHRDVRGATLPRVKLLIATVLPMSPMGHSRRFPPLHAKSGYPPKLTVKANAADRQPWAKSRLSRCKRDCETFAPRPVNKVA